MTDQAETLRQLVRAKERATPSPRARSLVFTSGKGGVGTSNIALNLALALGELGKSVTLVDADFGLANIDLLCGVAPKFDLGDVLSSHRPLTDAMLTGPFGVRILAGAHGTRTLGDVLAEAPKRLIQELTEIEADSDFLLIDAGSGLNPSIAKLSHAVDSTILVTTPEPTSMADAQAALRRFVPHTLVRLIVNQTDSKSEAEECLDDLAANSRQFLGLVVSPLGFVRTDSHVPRAVRCREPFFTAYPKSAAARDVRRLAKTLLQERRGRTLRAGLFSRLAARWRAAG